MMEDSKMYDGRFKCGKRPKSIYACQRNFVRQTNKSDPQRISTNIPKKKLFPPRHVYEERISQFIQSSHLPENKLPCPIQAPLVSTPIAFTTYPQIYLISNNKKNQPLHGVFISRTITSQTLSRRSCEKGYYMNPVMEKCQISSRLFTGVLCTMEQILMSNKKLEIRQQLKKITSLEKLY